jgi:hypothetical protein
VFGKNLASPVFDSGFAKVRHCFADQVTEIQLLLVIDYSLKEHAIQAGFFFIP